jgi:hypothetical protein
MEARVEMVQLVQRDLPEPAQTVEWEAQQLPVAPVVLGMVEVLLGGTIRRVLLVTRLLREI